MSSQVNISISKSESENLRCSYCRDDFGEVELWVCPACEAKLHKECYDELGKCATLGCKGESETSTIDSLSEGEDESLGVIDVPSAPERLRLFLSLVLLTPITLIFVALTLFIFFITIYQTLAAITPLEPLKHTSDQILGLVVISVIVGGLCYALLSIYKDTVKRFLKRDHPPDSQDE